MRTNLLVTDTLLITTYSNSQPVDIFTYIFMRVFDCVPLALKRELCST